MRWKRFRASNMCWAPMRYWVPGSRGIDAADKLMETLESEHWKLLLINSEYKTASDEVNAQLDAITGVPEAV